MTSFVTSNIVEANSFIGILYPHCYDLLKNNVPELQYYLVA